MATELSQGTPFKHSKPHIEGCLARGCPLGRQLKFTPTWLWFVFAQCASCAQAARKLRILGFPWVSLLQRDKHPFGLPCEPLQGPRGALGGISPCQNAVAEAKNLPAVTSSPFSTGLGWQLVDAFLTHRFPGAWDVASRVLRGSSHAWL